jgi:4'-phosphopantetheinyl transferase
MPPLPKSARKIATLDGVDLWLCDQDGLAAQVESYMPLLNAEELTRADRFHFTRDRNRFIIGRAVLRLILAGYLGQPPSQLTIGYGDRGKPYLLHQPASTDLRFNLAHAEGLALYAITRGREVGVDLEKVRPLPDAAAIAERFFAPAEAAKLNSVLGTVVETQAFFNCWTRKEAFVKTDGSGLSKALDSFEVTLLPEETPHILRVEGLAQGAIPWTLHALQPTPGFVAALVVET